jgi:hypothetical protein
VCLDCGNKLGNPCCFAEDGTMKPGPCGDGSSCDPKNGDYCVSDGLFGDPCRPGIDTCNPKNLSCQKVEGTDDYKCLCTIDFRPCSPDGKKTCLRPNTSPKFSNECGPNQKNNCAPDKYFCYDGDSTVKGQCASYVDLENNKSCNKFCGKPPQSSGRK